MKQAADAIPHLVAIRIRRSTACFVAFFLKKVEYATKYAASARQTTTTALLNSTIEG